MVRPPAQSRPGSGVSSPRALALTAWPRSHTAAAYACSLLSTVAMRTRRCATPSRGTQRRPDRREPALRRVGMGVAKAQRPRANQEGVKVEPCARTTQPVACPPSVGITRLFIPPLAPLHPNPQTSTQPRLAVLLVDTRRTRTQQLPLPHPATSTVPSPAPNPLFRLCCWSTVGSPNFDSSPLTHRIPSHLPSAHPVIMSQFFNYGGQHHPQHLNAHSHNHHGGRSRRAPRISSQQNNKQFRQVRTPKEFNVEPPTMIAFKRDFEAARSFDIEDDEMFCPFHLLTEDDVSSWLTIFATRPCHTTRRIGADTR